MSECTGWLVGWLVAASFVGWLVAASSSFHCVLLRFAAALLRSLLRSMHSLLFSFVRCFRCFRSFVTFVRSLLSFVRCFRSFVVFVRSFVAFVRSFVRSLRIGWVIGLVASCCLLLAGTRHSHVSSSSFFLLYHLRWLLSRLSSGCGCRLLLFLLFSLLLLLLRVCCGLQLFAGVDTNAACVCVLWCFVVQRVYLADREDDDGWMRALPALSVPGAAPPHIGFSSSM